MQVNDQFFGSLDLFLSFETCHEVNVMQLCSYSVHEKNM